MVATSSIKVTTYDDLSVLYKILRTVIRPFRPALVRLGKPLPSGSPQLSPPSAKCTIKERKVQDIYLYDFTSSSTSSQPKGPNGHSSSHSIFYFCGGGFQSLPSPDHWKFCAELCNQLQGLYEVTLVSYPLAPNSPAPQSLPALRKWLSAEASNAALNNSSITLMGDSSGGNIALSLGFWLISDFSNKPVHSALKSIFLISPATDLRNQNSDISETDKHDPILTVKLSSDIGKAWAGGIPLEHPDVSPIFSDPSLLRQASIKVHGVVGTHDILAPDAIKFRDACDQAGVEGEWLVWQGQMHCFPIPFSFGLMESKRAKDWIVDVLRANP